MKSYLLTGGTGYIGSHCCVQLFEYLKDKEDFRIILLDNLYNSSENVLDKIYEILNLSQGDKRIIFKNIDLHKEFDKLSELFESQIQEGYPIDSVIHFAAYKAVGESCQKPLLYPIDLGTMNLLQVMNTFKCKKLIFSSSATVYGQIQKSTENSVFDPKNPYGSTKVCIEYMLRDIAKSNDELSFISLRYYNPCGAHSSGKIGDSPTIYPNNLFPVIEQVVQQKREKLFVFGNDYETHDGTGVRDYIHVVDLADAHIAAINKLQDPGFQAYNIGTGQGYSVLEVIKTYEQAINRQIPHERRPGDVPSLIAIPDKAQNELNWRAKKNLLQMCEDSYNFSKNYH